MISNTQVHRQSLRLRAYAALGSALLLVGCGDDERGPNSNGGIPPGPGTPISVMTRNLYVGTDLTPLLFVSSSDEMPDAILPLWNTVKASDIPGRAQLVADEIVTLAPDLVALQEVVLYRQQIPSDITSGILTPNATEVVYDYLALILQRIAELGGDYRVAGQAQNGDAELPVRDESGGTFDLRLTDHDVILARDSIQTSGFVVAPFPNNLTLQVGSAGGLRVTFTRSVSWLNATKDNAQFVFANSHLEVGAAAGTQLAQAEELLSTLEPLSSPILLAGDFNSEPGAKTYRLLTQTFRDAQAELAGSVDSETTYTCCQAGDLRNPQSEADQRIDLVLMRGSLNATDVHLVGTDPIAGRTPGGLWGSDHFGVAATVELHTN